MTIPESPTEVVHQDDSIEPDTPDVEAERRQRRRRSLIVTAGVLVLFAIMWFIATSTSGSVANIFASVIRAAVEPQTAAVAIAVIGLNIHFGFTGLLNIGQAGFMLLGAYGFAISLSRGLPLPVAILLGIATAAVFASVDPMRVRPSSRGIR